MPNPEKLKLSFKIWLEYRGKPLLGKGGAEILEQIEKDESLSRAAKNLGMSYRYVWSYLQKIEKTIGKPIVETYRGGKYGGDGAKPTRFGKSLLTEYKLMEHQFDKFLAEKEKQLKL